MPIQEQKDIKNILKQFCDQYNSNNEYDNYECCKIMPDYSGRFMYGAICYGLIGPKSMHDDLVIYLAENGLRNLVKDMKVDNMGLDMIYYFPSVKGEMINNLTTNEISNQNIKKVNKNKFSYADDNSNLTESVINRPVKLTNNYLSESLFESGFTDVTDEIIKEFLIYNKVISPYSSRKVTDNGDGTYTFRPENDRYTNEEKKWLKELFSKYHLKVINMDNPYGQQTFRSKGDVINFINRITLKPLNNDLKTWVDEKHQREAAEKQAKIDARNAELDAVNISKYEPNQKILDKITAYRDKGSKVNVKAITDKNKLFTYYYAAKLLNYKMLINQIRNIVDDKLDIDILDKIDRDIITSTSTTQLTDDETLLNIGNTNGMVEIIPRHKSGKPYTWMPSKFYKELVKDGISIRLNSRGSGAMYDHNGCQWSEVEHFTINPGQQNEFNYDIAIHTNEGNDSRSYTGDGTSERTSLTNVINDIKNRC